MSAQTQKPAVPLNGVASWDQIETWEDFNKLKPVQQMQFFFWFRREYKNQGDIHSRVDFLLNPKNPLTTSILTEGQVDAQVFANEAANSFPVMTPLKHDADKRLHANISLKGTGRKQALLAVSLEEAIKRLRFSSNLGGEEDTRGFVDKHITKRGQSPGELEKKEESEAI